VPLAPPANVGMLENWNIGIMGFEIQANCIMQNQYSIIPLFHYSIIPFLNDAENQHRN
jgi:hypothetical protein